MGIGRVLVTGAIVLGGLSLLGACGWDITKERATDEAEITDEFSSVRFDNDAGNVTISTGDTPSIRREIHYEDEKPGTSHRVEGGALVLLPCPADDCWIDYEVVVPEGTTVDGVVESGNADVRGVSEVNLRASSGDVTIADVPGPVNVEASSGNVDLDGIGGAAQVQAASGNVKVTLTAPDDVRVEANSGNVEVTVPDASYQVDASTDSGNVDNQLGSDDAAGHQIDLHTDSGNIKVTRA